MLQIGEHMSDSELSYQQLKEWIEPEVRALDVQETAQFVGVGGDVSLDAPSSRS